MNVITIENDGPLITATNYWDSEQARAGKLFVSINAGAIRILLPSGLKHIVKEMRGAKTWVLSRGPWRFIENSVEFLFDDGSDAPFALHLTPESFDVLPAQPPAGREWTLSVWTHKDWQPHKELEQICHWRRVAQLPWLKPWKDGTTE